MAAPDPLIVGYQAAVAQVRARVTAFAAQAWAAAGSYRDADIDRLVRLLVPRVQAGQIQVANLTAAYLGRLLGQEPVPVDRAMVLDGRGIAVEEVYRRPAVEVYAALAEGAAFVDAARAGSRRLESLVSTDVQMAKVRQSRASLERVPGVVGHRRVLTGAENCALCVIASTQRYHKAELLPIHPGCDCGVAPIYGGRDPGQVINQPLLDETHDQIAGFANRSDLGARDLGRGKTTSSGEAVSDFTDLLITRDHGEYGPTLAWRGQHFDGPAAVH